MTTVTGLTAERMLAIEAASVVDGDVVGDDLFLTKKDGSLINAGNVRGARGPDGPMGHSLAVVTAQPVLDVGIINQIRAGRQLTPADFTSMGLSAPRGLWNLSTVADSSGNGRNLTNRGAVPFGVGINGAAATSAVFAGSAGQSLYVLDSGAADSFRIKTGSWGCWFRTARRGVTQRLISKIAAPGAISDVLFDLYITTTNVLLGQAYAGGAGAGGPGATDVADDRWHFAVVTADGSKIITYLDGAVELSGNMSGPIASTTFGPLNIGSAGDTGAGGIAAVQTYGRVDEAFVTTDVLSLDQIRNLMAASIPHTLAAVPATVAISVQKKRRGAPLATTDFPAQPLRLHNFVNGVLTDQGANNVPLALLAGTSTDVAGPDGVGATGGKQHVAATSLASTDTGLPSALAARSFGAWFKQGTVANQQILAWGGAVGGVLRTNVSGQLGSDSGADILGFRVVVADGVWHFGVVVEDNAAADGAKRKLYLDGKVIDVSLTMNSIALAGANSFKVGSGWTGQLSRAFVYGGALTSDQIRTLYNIGSQQLAQAPRNAPDFIRAMDSGRLLSAFDTVEGSDIVNISVLG